MSSNIYISLAAFALFAVLAGLISLSPSNVLVASLLVLAIIGARAVGGSIAYAPKMGLYAIVALVPLSNLGELDGELGVLGMVTVTRIAALASLALLVWAKIATGGRFQESRQGKFLVFFGLIVLMSAFVNERTAFTMVAVTRYFGVFILFILVTNLVETEEDIRNIFVIMAVSFCVSTLAGLLGVNGANRAIGPGVQAWNGAQRISGLSNENTVVFALNGIVVLVIALYFGVVAKRALHRAALFALSAVLLLGIINTYARSMYLACGLALVYLGVRLRKRVSPLYVVGGVALALVLVWPFIDHQQVYERIGAIGRHPRTELSYFRRCAYHIIGMDLFLRNPLFGVGPGNFTFHYATSSFRFVTDTFNTPGRYLHNMYLFLACDTGITGLALFLSVLFFSFTDYLSVARSYSGKDAFLHHAARAMEIAFAVYLIAALTLPTQKQKYLWLMIGLSAVMANLRRKQIEDGQNKSIPPHPSS